MTVATEGAIRELLRGGPLSGEIARRVGGANVPIEAGGGRLGDILAAPASAPRRPRAASLPPVAAGRVRLERADGAVVEVDAANAERALAETDANGRPLFFLDDEERAARRERRREYGDRPIETGVTSALSGATLGLSDVGLGALGLGDRLRALREENPDAASIGEIAGSVAPVLLAGPLGGEAVAARAGAGGLRGLVGAIGAPTRLLAGAAEGIGGAVARGAGAESAGALGRLGARALGLGVEGAIEGGVGEAGRILSETAIGDGDPDLTAEMVLARIGSGALAGGAAGSALGGAAGLLSEVGRGGARLAAPATDVITRAWSDSVGTELSPTVARAWGAISGRDPDAIARFLGGTEDGRMVRDLIRSGDAVYEDGTRALREGLNESEMARAALVRRWREGLRTDELERLVDPSLLERQAESARALAADIRERVRALETDFAGSPVGGSARGLGRELDRRISDIELAISRGDGARASAELNAALNGIKRDVDALVARSSGYGPAAGALADANDGIRRSLEDAGVWGDRAATAQREINAAFTRELTTRRAFAQRLLEAGGTLDARAEWNPFETVLQADSARVASFLRGAGTAANDTAEETFLSTVESTGRLIDTMARHLDLTPAERELVEAARRQAASVLDTFGSVRERAVALNQWTALNGGASDVLGRMVVGGSVGAALGGPLGAIAAGAATNPAAVVRTLATLERWSGGAAAEIASGVRDFLRATGARVSRASRSARRNVRAAATLGSVRAYQERVRRLDEEAGDPVATSERIGERVADLRSAPRTRDAMIAASTRANQYLASLRPRPRALSGQIVPTLDRPVSDEERERFMRAARVVDEPLSVLRDLRNGTLTRESVEALRQVYPRLYQRLVGEVMRQVGERGSDIDYERRLALGVLLGVPTDPALAPAHMATLQSVLASNAGAPMVPPTPRGAPRLASSEPYGSEALESDV